MATLYYGKIVYDANGGTGAPDSQALMSGTNYAKFVVSSTIPTRTGYQFLGWSEEDTAVLPELLPGVTLEVYIRSTNESNPTVITLYAVWKKLYFATLVFDANGGDDYYLDYITESNTTSSISIQIPTVEPTRSGYTFMGWSLNETDVSGTYLPGNSYTFTGATDTVIEIGKAYPLYAIWLAPYFVQIDYNANGGTSAPDSQFFGDIQNSRIWCELTSKIPTRDGYTFLGWAYSSTATSPDYYAGGTYELEGSTTTTVYLLYAVWVKNTLTGVVKIDTEYYHPYICYGGSFKLFVPYVCKGSWKTTEGS